MKKLNLSVSQLIKIVAENEIIGQGCYGIIYKLNDEMLFKFKYKDFIEDFEEDIEEEGRTINIRKLKDISERIEDWKEIYKEIYSDGEDPDEKTKKLIKLQDKIRLTKLTQGLVYVSGLCVGYLLHYHKNMVCLHNFLENNEISIEDKKIIFQNIENAVKELCDNKIYMDDLNAGNILINPENNSIQLIDFEDAWTSVQDYHFPKCVKFVMEKLKRIKNYIFSRNQEDEMLL